MLYRLKPPSAEEAAPQERPAPPSAKDIEILALEAAEAQQSLNDWLVGHEERESFECDVLQRQRWAD